MRIIILSAVMIGCGGQYDKPVEVKAGEYMSEAYHKGKDGIGSGANKTRQYFSDRNISANDFEGFMRKAGSDVGEQANIVRKYLSDRGFNANNVAYTISQTDDQIGRTANDVRDYLYPRGIEEMRHGDQSTTKKVDKHEARITELEARTTRLDSEVIVMNTQISTLLGKSDASAAQIDVIQDKLVVINSAIAGLIAQGGVAGGVDLVLGELIESLSQQLSDLSIGGVSGLDAALSELSELIATVDVQAANNLAGAVADLQGQLDDLSTGGEVLQGVVDALASSVGSQGNVIAVIQDEINALQEEGDSTCSVSEVPGTGTGHGRNGCHRFIQKKITLTCSGQDPVSFCSTRN